MKPEKRFGEQRVEQDFPGVERNSVRNPAIGRGHPKARGGGMPAYNGARDGVHEENDRRRAVYFLDPFFVRHFFGVCSVFVCGCVYTI